MTTAAGKPRVRVFLMTDYFTRSKDYYLMAEDENGAIEKGGHTTPTYIEEHDEKFESTEVQEEVAILVLARIAPRSGQPQQVYLLPAYEAEGTDAYHGYEILEGGEVSTVETAYPKSEWRLDERLEQPYRPYEKAKMADQDDAN